MIRKGMFIGDRYEILDKVGSGGMSDVYKAKCHKLNRNVAIKVLKSEFSEDKSFVSKFKVEAQSAAGLTHPNIVNVYDVGEDNGLYYIVMELIEGITLKKYIEKKGQLPVKEAVSIAIQVAQGIEAAHNNHIIHRDIKPQNIMISREGKVKVTDFGIARAASANTINSNAMGSVHYISPEQARGGYIDEKSDIYSLGITLFEMITGTVPFEGDSTVNIALQHIQEEIPSPKQYVPDLPISVEKIIEKCTQKKPDRRYLKVSTLIADLKRSLITPDEDFVQLISTNSTSETVMISDDEVMTIRKEAGLSDQNEEELLENNELSDEEQNVEDSEENDDLDDFEEGPNTANKLDKVIQIGGIVSGVVIVLVFIFIMSKVIGGGCDSDDNTPTDNQQTTTGDVQDESLDDKHTYVPNLINMTEEEAIAALEKAELGYKITSDYHNTIKKGFVIEQDKNSNSVAEKNSTVTVKISLGAKAFDIPEEIIGMDKEKAKEALEKLGLQVTLQVEASNDDEIEENCVIRTNPSAPTQVKFDDLITVYYKVNDTSNVTVPNLVGKTYEKAKKALSDLGLNIKKTDVDYSDAPAGEVISQSVTAEKSVPKGTTVSVNVSTGKQEEPTTVAPQSTVYEGLYAVSSQQDFDIPNYSVSGTKVDKGVVTAKVDYSIKTNTLTTPVSHEVEVVNNVYSSTWAETIKILLDTGSTDVSVISPVMLTVTVTYKDDDAAQTEKTFTYTHEVPVIKK